MPSGHSIFQVVRGHVLLTPSIENRTRSSVTSNGIDASVRCSSTSPVSRWTALNRYISSGASSSHSTSHRS